MQQSGAVNFTFVSIFSGALVGASAANEINSFKDTENLFSKTIDIEKKLRDSAQRHRFALNRKVENSYHLCEAKYKESLPDARLTDYGEFFLGDDD